MKNVRPFGPSIGKSKISKKFKEGGATILGGCCEIRPSHIKELSKLK